MTRRLGSRALHPAVVAAVLTVLLNDQLLKRASWFPTPVSGKLSDVAGLFAFPIVTISCAEVLTRRVASARAYGTLALVTAVIFAMTKVSPTMSAFVGGVWAIGLAPLRLVLGHDLREPVRFAQDRSDLWALLALVLSVMFMTRLDRIPVESVGDASMKGPI